MGKHCSVYGCNGNSDNGLSMHSFPKNPKIRRLWIKFVDNTRAEWTPRVYDNVCSRHFTPDDYTDSPIQVALGFASKS